MAAILDHRWVIPSASLFGAVKWISSDTYFTLDMVVGTLAPIALATIFVLVPLHPDLKPTKPLIFPFNFVLSSLHCSILWLLGILGRSPYSEIIVADRRLAGLLMWADPYPLVANLVSQIVILSLFCTVKAKTLSPVD